MKRIYLFIVFLCSVSTYAVQTTLTSSIYITEDVTYRPSQSTTSIPTGIRRVHFVNRVDDNPEIETALTAAEYIFSNAMKSVGVDLVNIGAEVLWGDATEFESDEVSKVSVLYTDSEISNVYYPYFNSHQSILPVLIPQSIYNQCSGVSDGPCMQIKLNPNMSYYFGTEYVPEDKIDAITIFLRSLAIGCGLQSTLNPNTLQFGIVLNGKTYINLFDTHIHNDVNTTYHDVAARNASAIDFLRNRNIYADGYSEGLESHLMSVQLYNDWEMGILTSNITHKTLNTVNPFGYTDVELNDGFYDLLDPDLNYGIQQQIVTPYTMALLRGLGWRKDITVGLDANLISYNSTSCCNSTTLQPNQTYQVRLSENASIGNVICNHSPLNITISISRNTLKYDLSSNETIDISNVVINSVQITSRTGNLMMTSTANPGDPINISSLTRGYYVLTVIADGNTYSRVFTKR